MIRQAKFADIPRLLAILADAHARSRYLAEGEIDQKAARALVTNCVQRHGLKTVGGTCVFVVERDGVVVGMVIGVLDRVYHIGNALQANDLFLIVTEGAGRLDWRKLVDAYVEWAEANPAVKGVILSATDAMGDFRRIGKAYARVRKAKQIGVIYERWRE